MPPLLRVEFHCHTIASKDSLTTPRQLIQAALHKGIDRVAVTDHNTIQGALRAREIDPERVIVGEEIKTTCGELLAFFVTEEVPRGLPPQEAIQRLRQQGAFISVSHPFDTYRNGGWKQPDLDAIRPYVDAIEVFNARCLEARFNQQARDYAQAHTLPVTVGSDAHTTFELGRALQVLSPFDDASSLKIALQTAQEINHPSPAWVHMTSRFAVWYKLLFPGRGQA